jgi:uncharacterized membrane protein YfhO
MKQREDVKNFFSINNDSKRIFYSKSIEHKNITQFLKDSKFNEIKENFSLDVVYYDGDNLVFDLNVNTAGWITFVDTWDHNWVVSVNNEPKEINKLFGAYKSVKIKSGFSRIEFSYKPFNFNFSKN